MSRHKVFACALFACFTAVCVACGDDGGDDGGNDDGGNGGCDEAEDCPTVNCPDGSTSQLCINGGCVTDASSACL